MIRALRQRLHPAEQATLPITEREVIVRFLMLVCRDNVPVPTSTGPGADAEQWVTNMGRRGAGHRRRATR
jgi:hypothetical protein